MISAFSKVFSNCSQFIIGLQSKSEPTLRIPEAKPGRANRKIGILTSRCFNLTQIKSFESADRTSSTTPDSHSFSRRSTRTARSTCAAHVEVWGSVSVTRRVADDDETRKRTRFRRQPQNGPSWTSADCSAPSVFLFSHRRCGSCWRSRGGNQGGRPAQLLAWRAQLDVFSTSPRRYLTISLRVHACSRGLFLFIFPFFRFPAEGFPPVRRAKCR